MEHQYSHDQLLAMIDRLINERDHLCRENDYLRAKLNESTQIETINEMKNERELLLKLFINLTAKDKQDHHQHHQNEQTSFPVYSTDDK
jgi:hypothetical protein